MLKYWLEVKIWNATLCKSIARKGKTEIQRKNEN